MVPSHGGWSPHRFCAGNIHSATVCSWDFHELQSVGPDVRRSNDGNDDDKVADKQEVPSTHRNNGNDSTDVRNNRYTSCMDSSKVYKNPLPIPCRDHNTYGIHRSTAGDNNGHRTRNDNKIRFHIPLSDHICSIRYIPGYNRHTRYPGCNHTRKHISHCVRVNWAVCPAHPGEHSHIPSMAPQPRRIQTRYRYHRHKNGH